MKQKFTKFRSSCIPLPLENVDTDQIIPARYLKQTTRDEKFFGDALFYDWRYNADGTPNTDFVLNKPEYSGSVLVAGKNFGSGSSREHAAWAIAGYGIRAVISSSIADIHKNNELNNFVLPIEVSPEFLQELFDSVSANPQAQVEIDLENQTVTNLATNNSYTFCINGYKKHCLLNGLDDIDYLVQNRNKTEHWENNGRNKSTSAIEIMDTTLRDGEQTNGVSFIPHEKFMIARMLLEQLKVDRVEVASAHVSEKDKQAVKMICDWAAKNNCLEKVEVLGFIDGQKSVDWVCETGCKTINLLCKGSEKHCLYQLQKSAEEHITDILRTINYANSKGITVNLYLEDWSNGIKDNPEYVFNMMDALASQNIKRFMLPDTLGVLNPVQVSEFVKSMTSRYPTLHFDFHAHNDYDLAVSNIISAILSGCKGIHTTVNGLGERAGNAPIASVHAILKDHFNISTGIDESRLNEISRIVESYSGIVIPANKPIVGENVFTQVAGVHADGDNKRGLYYNNLLPERFGRKREYAMGKNSGKASISRNLKELGLDLTNEQMRRVTKRITELGDKKETVTIEDLPYIVSDVLKHEVTNERVKLKSYFVNLAYGLKPMATLCIEINGKEYEESSSGDGQYDAFVRALRKVYKVTLGRTFPMLTNYAVTIPPGGRTDAFVQTVITWSYNNKTFRTRGFDADQTEAAIKATVKMLNIIEDEL